MASFSLSSGLNLPSFTSSGRTTNAAAYGNAVNLGNIYKANRANAFDPSSFIAQDTASSALEQSNAAGISGLLSAAGSIGSFGAAGGFGGAGAVGGDGGAAAGLTTPWDKSYDYFKDAPSFMGEGFSIPSYDFTSPFTN